MKIQSPFSSILNKIILKLLAINDNQSFWEGTFRLSLNKMNLGNGGDFNDSGELSVLRFVKNKLKNEHAITIFDVGANVGNYAKALSDVFGSKAKIYSFEPSKKTFELFLGTTKNLHNIISNNLGFSDKDNNQMLFTNSEGSGLASVYQRNLEHFGIKMDKAEEIRLTTINDYCYKNKIERIHFLKLDIEGHEVNALSGAKKMIEGSVLTLYNLSLGAVI